MSRFYDGCYTGLPSEPEAGGTRRQLGFTSLGTDGSWIRVWGFRGEAGPSRVATKEQMRDKFLLGRNGTRRRVQQTGSAMFLSACRPVFLSDAASFKQVSHLNSFRQVRGQVQSSS